MEEAVKTLHITAEHRTYNRGVVYVRGRRKIIPYSAYVALVILAAARKREPGEDGGWVSSWALAGTLKAAGLAAGDLRKMLGLKIEWDHTGWRRLCIPADEISFDDDLSKDRDYRIARLFIGPQVPINSRK